MLKKAKSRLELEYEGSINIKLDEATRDMIGSQNIPQIILNKISDSDIFIGDVSIINRDSKEPRKTPNPNVMFELGFGASRLGWSRIILLINETFGTVEDLPFDINRHRISKYTIEENPQKHSLKSKIGSFSNDLYGDIKAILDENPAKPVRANALNKEEIKRNKDIEHIRNFLSCIQIEILDKFTDNLPDYFHRNIWFFYHRMEDIARSTRFNLYNTELYQLMVDFWSAWNETLGHYAYYYSNDLDETFSWIKSTNHVATKEEKESWKSINESRKIMNKNLSYILKIIRNEYIELDVDKINEENYKQYLKYEKGRTGEE